MYRFLCRTFLDSFAFGDVVAPVVLANLHEVLGLHAVRHVREDGDHRFRRAVPQDRV